MNRIKELRQNKNISQSELAEAIDITRQAISLYEKIVRQPSSKIWQKLAVFFGVSVPYLQGYLFAKCHWCGNSFVLMNESEKDRYYYCPYCGRTPLDFGDMDEKYSTLLRAMVEHEKNKSEINE